MRQSRSKTLNRMARVLILGQGSYYLVTGVWPLFSPASFQKITGPKIDFWLVKTAGLLISVLGSILVLSARQPRLTAETALAGAGTAASLAGVDVIYTARRRISPIYLVDALVQAAFLMGWGLLAQRELPSGQEKERAGFDGMSPSMAARTDLAHLRRDTVS